MEALEDMIHLSPLDQENILENLKIRYAQNLIYTWSGTILVAVNPFQVLDIYTRELALQYNSVRIGGLPPHIFAVADSTYRFLKENKKSQSIIISGESGAGKSESTKLILQYLSSLSEEYSEIEQMILETSPVLEAFGNAKTIRNNNSSRFGKFVELQYDVNGRIIGSRITQYLLEKTRVISQAQNERNYHIFYHMLEGFTQEERAKYLLGDASHYHYLNQSGCYTVEDFSDHEMLEKVKTAFTFLKIPKKIQSAIFQTLCAILNLGNVQFKQVGEVAKLSTPEELQKVSQLLEIDISILEKALIQKQTQFKNETITMTLNVEKANENRDSFAKDIYRRLFEWIVQHINEKINPISQSKNFIGILDIFGFENFHLNSFEQLCINYSNEKLQHFFNETIFILEQQEYKKEGIQWIRIDFTDNEECIQLIESNLGLIGILDEQSRFPKATDTSYLEKIFETLPNHKFLTKPKVSSNAFIVQHYAGEVTYCVEGFLVKNRDMLLPEMVEAMRSSGNPFIKELFEEMSIKSTIKVPTCGNKFKTQLQGLVYKLKSTEPYYIRCIKPNDLKKPGLFDDELILAQLKYSGMLETIKIRKLGFQYRYPFVTFLQKYQLLVPKSKLTNVQERIKEIMQSIQIPTELWQIGKTQVFLKEIGLLEDWRHYILSTKAIIIQKYWRMFYERSYFLIIKAATVIIQRNYRSLRLVRFDRNNFLTVKWAAQVIQKFCRDKILRNKKIQKHQFLTRRESKIAMFASEEINTLVPEETTTSSKEETSQFVQNELQTFFQRGNAIIQNLESKEEEEEQPIVRSRSFSFSRKGSEYDTFDSSRRVSMDPFNQEKLNEIWGIGTLLSDEEQTEAPEIIKSKEEANSYKMEEYAKLFFQFNVKKGGTIKQSDLDKLVCYSKKDIKSPLHHIVQTQLCKMACQFFNKILLPLKGRDIDIKLLQVLLGKCVEDSRLRDEIYCQLMKQATQNPNLDQINQIWRILGCCTSLFVPGKYLLPYIASFYYINMSSGIQPIAEWASFCKKRLEYMVHNDIQRKQPPSRKEIEALLDRKPMICRISFTDGSIKSIYINSHTCALDAVKMLTSKLAMLEISTFAIYEVYERIRLERCLDSKEILADVLSMHEKLLSHAQQKKMDKDVDFKLLCKCKIFISPREISKDKSFNNYIFTQAAYEIASGYLPCSKRTAIKLAAMKLQIDFGNYQDSIVKELNLTEKYIPSYLIKNSNQIPGIDRRIIEEYKQLENQGKEELKRLYLQIAKELPWYGARIFSVAHANHKNFKFIVAVNVDGFHIVSGTLRKHQIHSFTEIERWNHTSETFELYFKSLEKSPVLLSTKQGGDISDLINTFTQILMKEARFAYALNTYVVTNTKVLSFKKGDMITILSKPDDNWFMGTLNDQKGLFPIDQVQLRIHLPTAREMSELREFEKTDYDPFYNPEHSSLKLSDFTKLNLPEPIKVKTSTISKITGRSLKRVPTSFLESKEALLSFSKTPITNSLLQIESTLQTEALSCFEKIMRYMGDLQRGSARTDLELLQDIIQLGIDKRELRDEIYCQIFKQVKNNPNKASTSKGWLLIALCAGCFPPSQEFLPFCKSFFLSETSTELKQLISYIIGIIGMKGRKLAPSQKEVESIQEKIAFRNENPNDLKNKLILCKINTLDGMSKGIYIHPTSTVKEARDILVLRLNVRDPEGFELCERVNGTERQLKEFEYICDIFASWELKSKKEEPEIVFKKTLFLSSTLCNIDVKAIDLEFFQAFNDLSKGYLPFEDEEISMLLALYLQAVNLRVSEDNIETFVPKNLLQTKSKSDWVALLKRFQSNQAVASKTGFHAKEAFLKTVRQNPLYGSDRFSCEIPFPVWLFINNRGLYLTEPFGKEILQHWSFKDISSYAPLKKAFSITVGNLLKPERKFFYLKEVNQVVESFEKYSKKHTSNSQRTKSTVMTKRNISKFVTNTYQSKTLRHQGKNTNKPI